MKSWGERCLLAWSTALIVLVLVGSSVFAADGDLDLTFNTPNGFIVTDADPTDPQSVTGVAFQSDGKIVVGGLATTDYQTGDAFLLRYTSDGTLDTSFGTSGIAHFAAGPNWTRVGAVAIQPDDKIVMGGFHYVKDGISPGKDSRTRWLARFCPNGQLDNGTNCSGSGFGTAGMVSFQYQASEVTGELEAIVVQSDGKILAGGYSQIANPQHLAMVRVCSNGLLDDGVNCGAGGFGTGGRIVFSYDADSDQEQISHMLELADDKILIGGFSASEGDWYARFLVMRLTGSGAPDNTFGTNGGVVTAVEPNSPNGSVRGLALQSDGKIIAAGFSSDETNYVRSSLPSVILLLESSIAHLARAGL